MSFTTALEYLAGITVSFLIFIFGALWLVGFCRRTRSDVGQPEEPEPEKKVAKAAGV